MHAAQSLPTTPSSDPIAQLIAAFGWQAGSVEVIFSQGDTATDVQAALPWLIAGQRVILSSNDAPEAITQALAALVPNLVTTRLYVAQSGRFYRVDPDGPSLVHISTPKPAVPLARDFASLLTARRIFRRALPLGDDYGRAAQARWITAQTGPAAQRVAWRDNGPHMRWFTPQNASNAPVIYLHGGGLVHYDIEVFSTTLSHLAQGVDAPVLAIGYEKCPENTAEDVIDGLMARLASVARAAGIQRIMGDSVGGLLALYAALRVVPGQFKQIGLLYPVLSLHQTFASYEVYGDGRLLDQADMRWFRSLIGPVLRGRGFDPLCLTPADFADLSVDLFTAGCDVLADEAAAFAARYPVRQHIFANLPHDFALYAPRLASAKLAMDQITETFLTNERGLK